jgi:hypothetical protein
MNALKRIGAAGVCAASLVVAAATPAAAFPPIGSSVTGTSDGRGIDFGALTTCRMSLSGRVTGHEMWGGGTIAFDRIAFTNCSSGATVTANALPWTLGTGPTLAAAMYPPDVDIATGRGTCRYSGYLLGSTDGAGTWWQTGDVYMRTAGCGGAEDLPTRVTLSLRDSDGKPVGQ